MSTFADLSQEELGSRRPRIASDVVVRIYDDGMIAWSPSSPRPTPLDGVTAVLFQIFDGSGTVDEIVSDVHDIVRVPEAVARNQVRQTLEQFATDGLLDGVEKPPPAPTKMDFFPAPPNP